MMAIRPTEDALQKTGARVKGQEVTNDIRWILLCSILLCKTFNAHINVKFCSSLKSITYVCKYVNNGFDIALAVFCVENPNRVDEITSYLSTRYISSNEPQQGATPAGDKVQIAIDAVADNLAAGAPRGADRNTIEVIFPIAPGPLIIDGEAPTTAKEPCDIGQDTPHAATHRGKASRALRQRPSRCRDAVMLILRCGPAIKIRTVSAAESESWLCRGSDKYPDVCEFSSATRSWCSPSA
ncbi:hypothetical protein ElyMa_002282900 [Elysia marginata]|uniref:Uncharacterized protein n=1 Tax=Elysia marginata TaxID=1093978 RepID=A0AAV4G2K8_9GAST|nr:hypothetical protein ElyMa_002282900 [Elysia marginata]